MTSKNESDDSVHTKKNLHFERLIFHGVPVAAEQKFSLEKSLSLGAEDEQKERYFGCFLVKEAGQTPKTRRREI